MNILVTGGAGFIGSHLCEALLKIGHTVINVDSFNDYYDPKIKRNNVEDTQHFLLANNIKEKLYKVEEGDIRNITFLKQVFEKYDINIVVHLAACAGVRPSIEDPALYADVNVRGTVNLLEFTKNYDIKKFVFASSSSVYGNKAKVPFAEKDIADYPISPYAATKKAGELLCYTYHSLYNINMACLRFFTVYGPRQRPDLAIHKFCKMILEEKAIPFYGDGNTKRDYTFIDDIIDGVIRAMDWVNDGYGKYEVFNLGESNIISLNQMVRTIEYALNKKAKIANYPVQQGDVDCTYADIDKAKNILGYSPHVKFEDGIKKFIDWYKAKF